MKNTLSEPDPNFRNHPHLSFFIRPQELVKGHDLQVRAIQRRVSGERAMRKLTLTRAGVEEWRAATPG